MPVLDHMTISRYLARRLHLNQPTTDAWHEILMCLMNQLEEGHTLLDNNTERKALLSQLPNTLVCTPIEAAQGNVSPLVADEHYIWLQRIWQAEYDVVKWILAKLDKRARKIDQSTLEPFLTGLKDKQRQAVKYALANDLTIINGGPGTGKTYTVAKLVQALISLNPQINIRLAAPTGKAANRMEMSLHQSLPQDGTLQLPPAKTIHSLLGIVPGRGARYNHELPLEVDVLIIDEASMLSLELMQQLVSALPDTAQVILLGDANQLAAVEPGAVLHDMTRSPILSSAVVTLTHSSRFQEDSVVGQLAKATLSGDETSFFATLAQSSSIWRQGNISDIEQAHTLYDELFAGYRPFIEQLQHKTELTDIFNTFEQYRILCAGRAGNLGSELINKMMRQRHLAQLSLSGNEDFYHGQPLMILANQPHLNLYNGDIGLCLMNDQQELWLYFPQHDSPISLDRINRNHIVDAYAFSIHKSQGSEFDKVAVCIDRAQQRLMSRELLYTAMTRAKKELAFYGKKELFTQAVNTPTERLTGIHVQLRQNFYST